MIQMFIHYYYTVIIINIIIIIIILFIIIASSSSTRRRTGYSRPISIIIAAGPRVSCHTIHHN